MNTEKIVRDARMIMIVCIIVGATLLGLGIVISYLNVSLISYQKGLVGLSFIPFSVAFVYYLKLSRIKKAPHKIKDIIVNESDERLVALRSEADAKAFKIIQGVLFLSYMGYTLMVPEDIFESVGWWILMVLLFITFISQGVLYRVQNNANKSDKE